MYFFFFKQKTAYEMQFGDWSSDVCSSDLDIDIPSIEEYRDGRDVYIVGVTNVGKSTLINQIIDRKSVV